MMPLLAIWVRIRTGGQAPAIIYWGLVFATLGDLFLDLPPVLGEEGPWFLLGMAFFFLMQISYIRGLLKMSEHNSGIPTVVMLGYVGFLMWVNLNLGPHLGDLQIPVAVYSSALASTAALTAAYGLKLGLGGLIFGISDFLILIDLIKIDFPYRSPIVGATYVIA